jgi:signal transduction histidine kinase
VRGVEAEFPASAGGLRPLLDAVRIITSDLDLQAMLHRITQVACDLVDAEYGALEVLDPWGSTITDFVTVGVDPGVEEAIGRLPERHGVLGLVISEDRPLRLADVAEHPAATGFPEFHPIVHSFLGVPISVRGDVFGNLYLGNKTTDPAFSADDEALLVALAGAAGIAITNARLAARVQTLALAEDRERIARDLHDTVIQRLFATGMSLQSTYGIVRSDPATASTRIEQAVDDLDGTIKDIRNAIFGLERIRRRDDTRGAILDVVRDAATALGFEPRLLLEGPVDTTIVGPLAEALVTTVREALSNVVRHAWATTVNVDVIARDELVLRVGDDGVGLPPDLRSRNIGRGLRNMRDRAEALGGTLTVDTGERGGTTVEWRVPIR